MDSPVIFDLNIDAVLRKVMEEIDFGGSELSFYADDSLLEHTDLKALQHDVDIVFDQFVLFGLKANREKIKFMVIRNKVIATLKRILSPSDLMDNKTEVMGLDLMRINQGQRKETLRLSRQSI